MPLLRRRRTPEAVRAVPLERGERRVAWALTDEGEPVVATDQALLLAGERLRWTDVEKAVWTAPRLRVSEVAEVAGAGRSWTVVLPDPGELTEAVHDRVTASVVWSQRVVLRELGGGVRLVARRAPGRNALTWQTVHDEGTDPTDPQVQAAVAALLQQARNSIG